MLNINKLNAKFDEILSSFTEDKVQQWIDFADNRELVDRLLNGESVDIILEKRKPKYIVADKIASKYSNAGENNYALAA